MHRHMSGLSNNYLYIDGRSISRKNRSIYKYYIIVYVVKRKKHCCNNLSSMTVSVSVRLLKGDCCQVLQLLLKKSVYLYRIIASGLRVLFTT